MGLPGRLKREWLALGFGAAVLACCVYEFCKREKEKEREGEEGREREREKMLPLGGCASTTRRKEREEGRKRRVSAGFCDHRRVLQW